MTCNQLGGACDEAFHADTFEKMAEQSRTHAMAMIQKGDKAHLAAMKTMQKLMESPGEMQAWMSRKRKAFDALPHSS